MTPQIVPSETAPGRTEAEPRSSVEDDVQSQDPSVEPLSLDLVFEVLKNERRRHVLHYLKDNPGTASLSDLAEYIASIENDKPISALSSQERKRVYVGLYQCHLPKMDDTDVVDFDNDRGTIELGVNAPQLYSFLEVKREEQRPWPQYYLGLTAVSAGLFLLTAVTLPSVLTVIFGATLFGFAVLAGVHIVDT